METRSKWLWTVTVANVAVACLLLLVIYSMMLALAVLAPEISGWPLYVLLPIGLALSIAGLRFTKGVISRVSRRAASVLNGCALVLDLLIILGLATMFFGSTKERFLIPDGYRGDVFVVYGAQDGEVLNKSHGEVTYRIPEDGILRTRQPMLRGWTRTEYYYLRRDTSLERIRNFWPTTIHPSPENLADDKDIGVYFPRTGTFTDSTGCSVQYQQFYVGTKAHLLSKYKENNLVRYVRDHPGACTSRP
jgi:uncharacterized protein DUF6843